MPTRDIGLVALICIAWAGNFLTSAYALTEIPPLMFTALRMALILALLFPFLRAPAPGQWLRLITISAAMGVMHFGLNFWGLKLAGDISSPAIVTQSYVPMATILAWLLLGERFAWRTGAAIVVSFAGVLVLGFDPLVLDRPASLIMMLIAAGFLAFGSVLMRGLRGVDLVNQQGWMAAVSLLPLLGLSTWLEPDNFQALGQAGFKGWFGACYSAFISSLLGHGLYFILLQRHPVAQVTPYLLLTPLLAIILGVAIWGDRPGPRLWIGGAMVLGGVFVIALRNLHKARAAKNSR